MLAPAYAQIAKRRPSSKGPRALGLLELAANGKARLLPVTIMIDGKFYDAGAYKADPVPMALQRETAYEVVKTGVSQGLFSVANARETDADQVKGRGWIADGKWRSTAEMNADKARAKADADKKAQKGPPPEQEIGGPPKLRRPGASSPAAETHVPEQSGPPAPGDTSSPSNTPSSSGKSHSPAAAAEDPNRPVLRRQAPSAVAHEQTKSTSGTEPLDANRGPIELIPAISDADGPEPRPYTYQMKPEAQASFLKKMLAMAGEEVRARAHTSAEKVRTKSKPQLAPQFGDVQLHALDLSSSNEPVLVLTANAQLPSASQGLEYMIALVAREDIYGELHKVFAQTTDNQHLDVSAQYEFIDAVDADGDGRGELLFRQTSDAGSAFAVYRVIGDKLWPLFQGKPGS